MKQKSGTVEVKKIVDRIQQMSTGHFSETKFQEKFA